MLLLQILFIISSLLCISSNSSPYRDEYVVGYSALTRMGEMCYSFLAALEYVYGNNTKTPLCY